MQRLDCVERRLLLAADPLREGAARMKAAPRGRVDRVRRVALQQRGLGAVVGIERRHRGEQRPGIGMGRRVEHRVGRADLGDPTEIHHHHPVGDEAHDIQVVADEDVGQAELGLEVEEQVKHLRLHGLVQRRHGLVEQHQPRLQGERPGDVHPLALAAGDLVRVAAGEAFRLQADAGEKRAGALHRFPAGDAVDLRAEGDRLLDGHARIERRVAVLEHHLDLTTIGPPGHGALADRLAVVEHLAGIARDQAHEQLGGGRFPAAGLADDAQRLPLQDVEVDAVDGADHLAFAAGLADRKVLDQP